MANALAVQKREAPPKLKGKTLEKAKSELKDLAENDMYSAVESASDKRWDDLKDSEKNELLQKRPTSSRATSFINKMKELREKVKRTTGKDIPEVKANTYKDLYALGEKASEWSKLLDEVGTK